MSSVATRDPAVVERDTQRVLVHQRAARDVDEVDAGLDRGEHGGVDEVLRPRRGRGREHDVIGPVDELADVADELDAGDRARRVGPAHGAHPHAERERPLGDRLADAAEADDARPCSPQRSRAAGSGSSSTSAARARTRRGSAWPARGSRRCTHSAIGTALAPRGARDDAAVVDRIGHLVDAGSRQLHPAHAGRIEPAEDLVPTHVAAEEHVGLQPSGGSPEKSTSSTSGWAVEDQAAMRIGRAELGDDTRAHACRKLASRPHRRRRTLTRCRG